MNKRAFTERLRARLRGLPRREVEERISFYLETIDDRIDEGLSEEAAIDALGTLDEVAEAIRVSVGASAHQSGAAKEWRAWEIILLVLGSPLWLPLLIAGGAVVLSVLIVIWSVNLVLWAVEAVFFIFALASKYMIVAFKAMSRLSLAFTKATLSKIKKLFSNM